MTSLRSITTNREIAPSPWTLRTRFRNKDLDPRHESPRPSSSRSASSFSIRRKRSATPYPVPLRTTSSQGKSCEMTNRTLARDNQARGNVPSSSKEQSTNESPGLNDQRGPRAVTLETTLRSTAGNPTTTCCNRNNTRRSRNGHDTKIWRDVAARVRGHVPQEREIWMKSERWKPSARLSQSNMAAQLHMTMSACCA